MSSPTSPSHEYLHHEFVITHTSDAPRELVFDAWVEPRHLVQWWGPKGFTNPSCKIDVRPGGKIEIVMRAPNGTDYPMGGEYREIVPPERLVYTTGALDPNGKLLFELLHTAVFVEHEGKTTLTLTSRVIMTTPDVGKYIGGFEAGMTQSLYRLGDLVASPRVPFVIERVYDAPAASVWRAITDKEAMKQWYFDLPEFKPEVGFEFGFDARDRGVTFVHRCVVTEVVAQKRLSYSWRYEGHAGNSLVTFELFSEGERTRLKLTHRGLETFPRLINFAPNNFAWGWTHLVGTALKGFVEGGTESSGTKDREIVVSREYDAPRELIWEAITEPQHVSQWWGPRGFSTTIEEMDVRVGGSWKHVMKGPDGARYPNHSVFKEVTKPSRLVFAHGGHKEGGSSVESIATWTFEAIDGDKTRVTMRMVFPSPAERDRVVREFGAVEGGKQCLERLGEHLAGKW